MPDDSLQDLPIEGQTAGVSLEADRRTMSRIAVLGTLAAAAAIVAGMVLIAQDGDPRESGADGIAGDIIPDGSEGPSGARTAAGAVDVVAEDDNGVESIVLSLSDQVGLRDGQMIAVAGRGFTPDFVVWIAQCSNAPAESGLVLDECDAGTVQLGIVRGDGSIAVDFSVYRYIRVDGDTVDCSIRSCAVSAVMTDQPTRSGSATIGFASSPGARPPILEIDVTAALVDGQQLTVTGTGFAPTAELTIVQCVIGVPERVPNCIQRSFTASSDERIETDGDGKFTSTTYASRLLRTFQGEVDCGEDSMDGHCVLMARVELDANVASPLFAASLELHYDPDSVLPGPGVAIEPQAGFGDLEWVTITVTEVQLPGIELCAIGTTSRCVTLAEWDSAGNGVQVGSTFTLDVRLPRMIRGSDSGEHDCVLDGPCELRVLAPGFPSDPLPLVYDARAPLAD